MKKIEMDNNRHRRNKVLLLIEYDVMGGTRTYVKQLIEFYARNEFDLFLFSDGPGNDPDMTAYCDSLGVVLNSYKDHLPINRMKLIMPLRIILERFHSIILQRKYKPDVIVASTGNGSSFFGFMKSPNSIYILHSSPINDQSGNFIHRMYRNLIFRYCIPRKCRYVAVSNYLKTVMVNEWALNLQQVPTVIYNSSGDIVNSIKKHNSCFNVLTVGHVIGYKNPLFWIDCAKVVIDKIKNITFTWVGHGPLIEHCMKVVSDLGLSDKIIFTGLKRDLSQYYINCDIYLQPSIMESLGLAVLDAMRFGKPSIVSNAGGLPELIIDGLTGYVVDLNDGVENFANRITQLVMDETTKCHLGKNAQITYSEKFSFQKWEKEMLMFHQEII